MRNPKDKADSKYNPDIGISKEDEERYQKLVSENDDLQKLIAQVSFFFSMIAQHFFECRINKLFIIFF